MNAEQFIKWLRDALAHGDGRTIRPLHKLSNNGDKTLLAGFRIVFPATRGLKRNLILSLYHDDMRRLGSVLAEEFCNALKSLQRTIAMIRLLKLQPRGTRAN
jgi:hypothetical protein